MNQYTVRIERYVFDENKCHEGLRIEKTVVLPFVPFKECEIGLDEHSDFGWDCSEIMRIVWLHLKSMFLVELEAMRLDNYDEYMEEMITNDGWEVMVGHAWKDKESALRDAEDDDEVVGIDEKFYLLTPVEVKFLKMGKRNVAYIRSRDE